MNPTTPDTRNSRKRSTTIGVAAGLLAGGAIGLVAAAPSITGAAADGTVDDAVAVQEEVTDPIDETAAETTDARPEPGEHLREVLQPLVDDGTIEAAQADAVAEYLAENRPERERQRGRRGLDGHGPGNPVVADLLGTDRETLRAELEAGSSIADIAEANGIDVQSVIDALVDDAASHLDLAVDHGRLDEEAAAERLEQITERITDGVYRTHADAGDANG